MARKKFEGWILAASLALLAWEPYSVSADETRALEILRSTGIRGGLVVHLGCGDGRLTAALRANESLLVEGLDADPKNVEAAREHVRSLGLYGNVSIEQWTTKRLPYADNLVNLLVLSKNIAVNPSELLRVLVPNGVALRVDQEGGIDTLPLVKPRPVDIDEWTHWQHDASNNAVAHDGYVGPPRSVQWIAEPLWPRGHEVITSVGAVVTARGRIFYALDEAPAAVYSLPSKWVLVARDAFNGVLLWKRPIPHWSPPVVLGGFAGGFRPLRLVTDGTRVYLPLGEDETLSAMDAASGQHVKTLAEARGLTQVLCADGLLIAVLNERLSAQPKGKPGSAASGASLLAAKADTLDVLWKKPLSPQLVALNSGTVYCVVDAQVVAIDARNGKETWQVPLGITPANDVRQARVTRLLIHGGSVYVAGGAWLKALSATTGKLLWEQKTAWSTSELFAAAGLLWRAQGSNIRGYDPQTGAAFKTIDASGVFSEGHHPRCYPCKATDRYLITNNRGAEFVSLTSDQHVQNDWVRGNCGHGVLPANGLLYAPPNPCFCYPGVKITGFNALTARLRGTPDREAWSTERGPAFPTTQETRSLAQFPGDWPTYRHDGARSGATACELPADVVPCWTVSLDGPLTPPVVCDGRVYVASKDTHTIHAIAIADGRKLWQFTAGGRIDSPPSVLGETVLFGCADGRVYCVRAADGALVWKFQAAPSPERIVAFGQLESPWRVHGSVLIHNGLVYFTAGRSSYLDGGLRLFALDPATGSVVHQAKLDTWRPTRDDAEGQPFVPAYVMEGALSDILVSDGQFIYLGQNKFDGRLTRHEVPYVMPPPGANTVALDISKEPYTAPDPDLDKGYKYIRGFHRYLEQVHPELVKRFARTFGGTNLGDRYMGRHLMATGGFLDDTWFNRTFWTHSATWPGWYLAHRGAKCGQLLVIGPKQTYAIQAFTTRNRQSPILDPAGKGYLLLADANDNDPILDSATRGATKGLGFTRQRPPVWFDWLRVRVRGMVLAGQILFVAGPPDVVDPADPAAAFEGRKGGVLRAYSAAEGKMLAEHPLAAPPVFDGLIAAAGRLFLSTTDGKLVCLDARQ